MVYDSSMRSQRLILILGAMFVLMPMAGAQPRELDRDKPDLPDLSVRFIERTPRFPGTHVEYLVVNEPSGNRGDGLPVRVLNPRAQKWPNPGQTVTFTAHLRNAGRQTTPRFDWYWLINGRQVRSGWDRPLRPGEERTYSIEWKWQSGRNHVAFETNRDRKFEEITHKNNFVVDRTDALAFHFFVQPGLYRWFQGVRNGRDSFSWDDWAQFQVQEMNRTFANDIFPATPEGIEIRVRLDKITMLPEDFVSPGGMHVPDGMTNVTSGWDGLWGFTDGYLVENEHGLNVYEQLPHWVTGVEWSLMHELGHQLGQPDYYLLPVDGRDNGALPGVPYDPPSWFRDQMMFAGNHSHDRMIGRGEGVWDSGYRFWEEHSARSFNRDGNKRRGFFGTFMVDIPRRSQFVFLDEHNVPISAARVAMHVGIGTAYTPGRFDAHPDATGVTDRLGRWTLDRSPWRVLLNWTTNGAVQFVVTPEEGPQRVGFLNITHFNLAYWRGQRELADLFVATRTVESVRR